MYEIAHRNVFVTRHRRPLFCTDWQEQLEAV
jgi:hypothetical protein